jgi:hypothetical protein
MPNGLVIALFGATSWAMNSVLVSRLSPGTGEPFTTTAARFTSAYRFFALVLTLAGKWSCLRQHRWQVLCPGNLSRDKRDKGLLAVVPGAFLIIHYKEIF